MKPRTTLQLLSVTLSLGCVCVTLGAFGLVQPDDPTTTTSPAAGPGESVGKDLGRAIDEGWETARDASKRALSWLRAKTEKGVANLEQRLDREYQRAKDNAPEPITGVRELRRDAATAEVVAVEPAPNSRQPGDPVLLIHGFNEPGGIFTDLGGALIDANIACATFHYPNDQPLLASSALLRDSLATLKQQGVQRVTLVAHSMGGLVARDVLTSPDAYTSRATGHADLPDVSRFIMAGTPNIGSHLAAVGGLAEAREALVRWARSDFRDARQLLAPLKDGRGEAADDMLPGSAFLLELNSRPLPDGLPVTAIVGVIADDAANSLEELVRLGVERGLLDQGNAAEASRLLQLAVANLGDGIVSQTSQTPEGVADVVKVHGNHRTIIKTFDLEKRLRAELGLPARQAPGIAVVLERLKADEAARATPPATSPPRIR